jgi:hypothetical protein
MAQAVIDFLNMPLTADNFWWVSLVCIGFWVVIGLVAWFIADRFF